MMKIRELKSRLQARGTPVAVVGGKHILINGDCIEVARTLVSVGFKCHLFLNDPPYGTTSCPWDTIIPFDSYWWMANAVTDPKGAQVVFSSQPFTSLLVTSNLANFRYSLVWNKNKCGSPGLAKYRPLKVHEDMNIFSCKTHAYYPQMEQGEAYSRDPANSTHNAHGYGLKPKRIVNTGTRYPKSIRNVSRDFSSQQQVHPTQKPVPLLEWIIHSYTQAGEAVFDPTAGSGSTAVAAVRTGRRSVCIEQDPAYYAMMVDRVTHEVHGKHWDANAYRKLHFGG